MSTELDTESDTDSELAPIPDFLSIVVPCLNEEVTIGEFVDWCHEGLAHAGVDGEVVIVDSSTDRSPEIAEAHGARVLRVPRRGLGRAYIDAIPHIRGEFVLMGDCDLTYDFRELQPFLEKLRSGYEFVMGTRSKGYIEPGAMPKLHRYFGSAATTWIFNRIYGTHYSDIHSGMRAMSLNALQRMNLQSQGWEYASEMILKARRLGFRSTEVPIRFYKDREGRESHLKRAGWTAPWRAGWDSLRVMLLNAPEYFLRTPGWFFFLFGLAISSVAAAGPVEIFGLGIRLHWMLLGVVLAVVGYSAIQLATLARIHYNYEPERTQRTLTRFSYNRGMALGAALVLLGLIPCLVLLVTWIHNGARLTSVEYPAVYGLEAIILGCQTFGFTLLLHMIGSSRVGHDAP
jgi:glycosyltransferase involved in cell wall biosynthesis